MTGKLEPELLLAHESFVRRIARGLLQDPSQVDDVVQQAWLRALEMPPRERGALRRWLGTVARNLALNERASARARERRERAAPSSEPIPSPVEILERESLRRAVVEEALALPEPYRAVLVLRYFEDLEPRVIATRLNRPAATVRTQLRRGLEMLRARLDRAHSGDRRSWALSLIPLAHPRQLVAAGVIGAGLAGVVTMKKIVFGAVAAVLLIGATWTLWPEETLPETHVERLAVPAAARRAKPVGGKSTGGQAGAAAAPTRPAVKTGAHTDRGSRRNPWELRLVHADGSAAVGSSHWFERGAWLREEGFCEPAPLPDRTEVSGPDGELRVDRRSQGLLWCVVSKGLRVAFALPSVGSRLRLPKLAELHIAGAGLGADDAWRVVVSPAAQDDQGNWAFGRALILPDRWDGARATRALLRLAVEERRRGSAKLMVPAVHEARYHVMAEADAWELATSKPRFVVAPSFLVFRAVRLRRTMTVTILDGSGRLAQRLSGRIIVESAQGKERHDFKLENGRGEIGVPDLREDVEYKVWVVLSDGELHERSIGPSGELGGGGGLSIVRGRGTQAVLVRFREADQLTEDVRALVENTDGELVAGTPLEQATSEKGPFAFVVLDKAVVLLMDMPEWRGGWLLRKDGAVARITRKKETHGLGRWLPTGALPPVDLNEVLSRYRPRGPITFLFELQLTTSRKKKSWQIADRVQVDAVGQRLPVWRKRDAVRVRFRMLSRGRPPREFRPPRPR